MMQRFRTNLHSMETGTIGRQRAVVLIYSSLILLIGILLNLGELTGPTAQFFKIMNVAHFLLTALILVLYYLRGISIICSMSLFCIIAQMELSAECIHCAMRNTSYDITLIVGNTALSAIVLLLSIIAYLQKITYLLAALSMATLISCICITGNDVISNLSILFLLVFLLLTLLGIRLRANISELTQQKITVKEQDAFDLFQLNKEQLQSFITLARQKNLKSEVTAELLTVMGKNAKRHIRDNVAIYLKQTGIEFDKVKARFPELSPSEIEICVLVLKGMKLKEIGETLGKSASNITCQRTNIRSKLGLKKEDNLFAFLKSRMEGRL